MKAIPVTQETSAVARRVIWFEEPDKSARDAAQEWRRIRGLGPAADADENQRQGREEWLAKYGPRNSK